MIRTLLKSKIHRATVTEANLHYEGSITIDRQLMDAARLVPFEQVEIYDITNGARITTYVIEGVAGSGTICVNGAAAHLVHEGDLVIIANYAQYNEDEVCRHVPRIILVDAQNRPRPESPVVTTCGD